MIKGGCYLKPNRRQAFIICPRASWFYISLVTSYQLITCLAPEYLFIDRKLPPMLKFILVVIIKWFNHLICYPIGVCLIFIITNYLKRQCFNPNFPRSGVGNITSLHTSNAPTILPFFGNFLTAKNISNFFSFLSHQSRA